MSTLLDTSPNIIPHRPSGKDGIAAALHLSVFITAVLVIALRRPDALLHAQFYGEDGAIWFAEAYNYGPLKALFFTYNGYIQVLPRLVAAVATAAPFRYAPLIENVAAIALQALPVNLLLSRRSHAWGSLRFRGLLAVLYLILPNTGEMIGTITESQWILALCAFLLMVAERPHSRIGKGLDLFVFALSSITGPFCIFLFMIALVSVLRRKDKWNRLVMGIFLAGSLLQIGFLLLHDSSRYRSVLGVGFGLFVRILGGQIYLGTLFGANVLSATLALGTLLFVACTGTAAILLASSISSPMRRFTFFSGALFAASLAHPIVYQVKGAYAWEILTKTPGAHYWFLPSLAFGWSILYCFRSRNQLAQIAAGCLAFFMVIGVVRDYRVPAFTDLRFPEYAAYLHETPKGAIIVIPQNPNGWQMKLVKR